MSAWSVATITIFPDAFADAPAAIAAHASSPDARLGKGDAPAITVEVARLVSALRAAVPSNAADAAASAFEMLERSHGWTRQTFPSRTDLVEVSRGRGFLEEGPYLGRALMLLDAPLDNDGKVLAQQQGRLQAIADYLDEPAPVDAW